MAFYVFIEKSFLSSFVYFLLFLSTPFRPYKCSSESLFPGVLSFSANKNLHITQVINIILGKQGVLQSELFRQKQGTTGIKAGLKAIFFYPILITMILKISISAA